MNRLRFYLIMLFFYGLAVLPFRVLYFLSDFLNLLLFGWIGYRKKVIYHNLKNSFPEKTEGEIDRIAKDFYQHFCDTLVETAKMITIGKKAFLKRCHFVDLSLFEKYYKAKQNLIVTMGHFGNWEWGNYAMSLSSAYQLYAVYKPLQNSRFDRFVYKIRSRFGALPVSKDNIIRLMFKERKKLSVTALIADQTPNPKYAYWANFLNQETAIYQGTEKIAQKMNYPVLFASIRKIKRGYYQIYLKELFSNPKETSEGEITERHTAILEDEIRKYPHTWLWSHKRWKHKRIEEVEG